MCMYIRLYKINVFLSAPSILLHIGEHGFKLASISRIYNCQVALLVASLMVIFFEDFIANLGREEPRA